MPLPEAYPQAQQSDLSTEERFTGRHWHDGKRIYQKVVLTGALPNATFADVPTGVQMETFIRARGIARNGTNDIPLPHIDGSNSIYIARQNGNQIRILTGGNRTAFSGHLILLYTRLEDFP